MLNGEAHLDDTALGNDGEGDGPVPSAIDAPRPHGTEDVPTEATGTGPGDHGEEAAQGEDASKAFFRVEPYASLCARVREVLPGKHRRKTIDCAALMMANPGPLRRDQMGSLVLGPAAVGHVVRNWAYQALNNLGEANVLVTHPSRPARFELTEEFRAKVSGSPVTNPRDLFGTDKSARSGDLVGFPMPVSGYSEDRLDPVQTGHGRWDFFGREVREEDMEHAIATRREGLASGAGGDPATRGRYDFHRTLQPWMTDVYRTAYDAAAEGRVTQDDQEALLRFEARFPRNDSITLPNARPRSQDYLRLDKAPPHPGTASPPRWDEAPAAPKPEGVVAQLPVTQPSPTQHKPAYPYVGRVRLTPDRPLAPLARHEGASLEPSRATIGEPAVEVRPEAAAARAAPDAAHPSVVGAPAVPAAGDGTARAEEEVVSEALATAGLINVELDRLIALEEARSRARVISEETRSRLQRCIRLGVSVEALKRVYGSFGVTLPLDDRD